MDISRKLAEFTANTRFEDIPKEVVEVEKRSILDNIAIISGGAGGDGRTGKRSGLRFLRYR